MSIGVSDEQFSGWPKRGALGNGIIAIRAITQSARGANTALKHAHAKKECFYRNSSTCESRQSSSGVTLSAGCPPYNRNLPEEQDDGAHGRVVTRMFDGVRGFPRDDYRH